jgi:peptidoglycan/xylan/chitin deacetylase (PgdA/CDA1 family)
VEWLFEAHYDREPTYGDRDFLVESDVSQARCSSASHLPLIVCGQFEYGTRAGLPRIVKLFDKFQWPFTIWMCGRALELSPEYGPLLVNRGHEMACHGYRWRGTDGLSGYDEEAELVRKSINALQAATGRKDVPAGWFTGNGSEAIKHIHARVGLAYQRNAIF